MEGGAVEIITNNLDLWGEALRGTMVLFVGGGILALVLGFVVGAMRVSPIPRRGRWARSTSTGSATPR
jgi:glutamate transport system permease protein